LEYLQEVKLYKADKVEHHIYLRHPGTGAIHTHSDPDVRKPYLHVDLAKKVGLPDSGAEHSKLERGFYSLNHTKKQTIVKRAGLGKHEKGEFVHNDVVRHIAHKHPETKDYNVRDDSDY